MHPWMIQQLASEHRRDLLARASRRRLSQGFLARRRRGQPRPPAVRLVLPLPRPVLGAAQPGC